MSVTAKKDLIKVKYRTTTKRDSISHSLLPAPLSLSLHRYAGPSGVS